MNQIQTLFKNVSWVTASQVVTNICAFLWTILIARYLGVTDYGTLSFVISFTVLIGMGTDIGVSTFTTRDLAQEKSKTKKFIDNLILFKIILSIVLCIITVLIVYLLGYSNLVIELTLIMFIEASFVTMFNFVNGVFQAHENLKPSAIGVMVYSISLLALVFIVSFLNLGILAIAISYAIGYLLGLIYVSYNLFKEFGVPKFEVDLSFWKNTTIKSIPFGLSIFFYMIYFSIDVVMISWLAGDYATGIYNSAYKVISVFTAFYVIYQFVIFPLMSKLYSEDTDLLKISFEQSFKYSLLILLPIIILVYFYSPYLITLIYSAEFSLASIPMQILIWTVIFLFINGVATSLLNSIGKEFSVTKIYVIAAIFNIVLNYLFIPKYTYIGASVATVLSEILILVLMMYSISKTKYKPNFSLLNTIIKLLVSGLIFAIAIYFINVSLWLAIPIGLVIYIFALVFTKSIDDIDKYIFKELLGK